MLNQIESVGDSTIPLHEDESLIKSLEQELEHDQTLGPEVDLKLILGADDDEAGGSGRNSPFPLTPCSDETPVPQKAAAPSRPPPPPPGAPLRAAPPAIIAAGSGDPFRPMRPAPPPPVKAPLMKQEALIAPSITKTAPSTDCESEASQDGRWSLDREPDPVCDPFDPDPVEIANNGWSERESDPISGSPLPPAVPPPPAPSHELESEVFPDCSFTESVDKEADEGVSAPPPQVAPPPPPVPECGPRIPPPIPSRAPAPCIPPRPRP